MLKKILNFIYFFSFFCFLIFITRLPFFYLLNIKVFDRLQDFTPRDEIVLILIDEESIDKLGSWPIKRDLYIKALSNIQKQQPKAIGIDIFFKDKKQEDEKINNQLKELNKKNNIVLASKIENNKVYKPIFDLDSGFVNFPIDKDGKIRYFYEKIQNIDEKHFATVIFEKYLNKKITVHKDKLYLSFSENFRTLSFYRVLNNDFDINLKNKIILIGIGILDSKDPTDTYIDIFNQEKPRIFLHANALNSYLNDKFFTQIPTVYVFLILFIFSTVLYKKQKSKNFYTDFLFFITFVFIYVLIGIIFFERNIIFEFIQGVFILTFIYIFKIFSFSLKQKKQNRFIKQLFSMYVNKDVLKSILEKKEKIFLSGQEKNITILFLDIRGFTKFSENKSPTYILSFLNNFLSDITQIIFKNDGTIDKYMGDGVMCFFNAPISIKNHEYKAIKASLEIKQKVQKKYKNIKIGIGIHTGIAVVGSIGSNIKKQYTAIGDSVNLASRIESLTKKYKLWILVTQDTVKNIKTNDIIFRKIDYITVKGKTKPIFIYEPLIKNEQNLVLKQKYEKAFKLLLDKEFDKACKIFKNLAKSDPVSDIMKKRIKKLKTLKNWDGIWHFQEK